MPTGRVFVGYWLCCPSCGTTHWYLQSEGQWVESGGWSKSTWTGVIYEDGEEVKRVVEHVETLSGRVTCYGCGRVVVVIENEIGMAVDAGAESGP